MSPVDVSSNDQAKGLHRNGVAPRLLVVSQVYVPDPASVGQHLAGAAETMAARGWKVRVLTSAAGYDDPSVQYATLEQRNGVSIERLSNTSFGKRSLAIRIAGQLSFVVQCAVRGLFGPRADVVLVSTSPPFAGVIALAISYLRGSAIAFWAMDINPDQAVATGAFGVRSPQVRLMNAMNRWLLRRASRIVALDRYMADTLLRKVPASAERTSISPPWPHEELLTRVEHEANPFRTEHQLQGKFVVMYSGNHSPVHPLTTLLDAAVAMAAEPIVFVFIGGGQGKRDVQECVDRHGLTNVLVLPYQPIECVRYSLSAADVHVVSMGNEMIGIVHPCKFYGAMALAKPVLLVGPNRSHVGDVIREAECGWQVNHGATEELIELLRSISRLPHNELEDIGRRGRDAVRSRFSEQSLRSRLADLLEASGGK